MKNNQGFTLIELIITLAVVSILFAVAGPNILFASTNNRLTTQYNSMRGDFAFARNMAITRNVPVSIVSRNGVDWSNGWDITTPTQTVRVSESTSNMAISGATATITYNSDGTAANANFTVCDDRTGNYGKKLNVNFAGRVSLTKNATCPAPAA